MNLKNKIREAQVKKQKRAYDSDTIVYSKPDGSKKKYKL
jgi:hypothetical protein